MPPQRGQTPMPRYGYGRSLRIRYCNAYNQRLVGGGGRVFRPAPIFMRQNRREKTIK